MIITIGVIAYNEKNSLGSLLKDICKQTYDHKKIEVILVDSNSTDNTKVIMETFRKINSENNTTIIIVTHDPRIGESTKRCIRILDGQIVEG